MNIPKGWKLVPVMPTPEMQEAYESEECHRARFYDASYKAMLAAAPTPPAQSMGLPPDVLNALRFYANGEHFNIDHQEFDTVSGEPDNWLHSQKDDDCTMIEDGSIAKAVLQGKHIQAEEDEPESVPIEGEVFSSAPPAQDDEPVAFRMRHHLETEERDWSVMPIRFLERNKQDCYVIELLYTHPANDKVRDAAWYAAVQISLFLDGEKAFLDVALEQLRDAFKQ